MTGWLPIESAPKDGTVIDLRHQDGLVVADTWWDDDHWITGAPSDGYTLWRPRPASRDRRARQAHKETTR